MIEAYSNNIEVSSNAIVPFNKISVERGCCCKLEGGSTVKFNKCGTYIVSVSATAIAGAVGGISLQAYKDNVAMPNTLHTETAANTSSSHNLSFAFLVPVTRSCNCKCCSSPVELDLRNVGVDATFSNINITVSIFN